MTYNRKQIRVLIGHQKSDAFIRLANTLRMKGFWTVIALQTKEILLNCIQNEHPDVMILDVEYPTLDYCDLLPEILSAYKMDIYLMFERKKPYLESGLHFREIKFIQITPDFSDFLDFFLRKYETDHPAVQQADPDSALLIINRLLRQTGIPPQLQGYSFLYHALKILVKDKAMLSVPIVRIYQQVAEEYRCSPASVERSIRNAIAHMKPDGEMQQHLTNSAFLAMLLDQYQEQAFQTL